MGVACWRQIRVTGVQKLETDQNNAKFSQIT